jgi:small-conductance mechanosensitive channel
VGGLRGSLAAVIDRLKALLAEEWHGISGLQWIVASALIVAGTALLLLVRRLAVGRLRKLADRSATDFDDFLVTLVGKTRGWFLALLMARAATLVLQLSERWDGRAQVLLIVGGMVQGGIWASTVVRFFVDRRFAHHAHAGPTDPRVIPVAQTLLRFAGLVFVWSIVLLATLSSFGIDITGLVAGLGIGGVAIALAVQKVLGDVLASISIAVDRPFAPGDYIAIGEQQGTVRRIGIRSTVIGGLGGEELVVANNDMLSARIQNYTRMTERRVAFTLRLVYDTPQALLEALPGLIKQVIEGQEKVRFDRGTLMRLADWALEFEVVYWMTEPDYGLFARTHQQVLLELLRRMRDGGYAFAFPTRAIAVGEALAEGAEA